MAYNILIVDDSLPMRSVIKKTIKASGFKVDKLFEASNGREALDVLRKEWLDLVLVDYNMPDMNGLELMSEMQKDDTLRSIPVIMTTVEGSQKRVKEFIKSGATDYIKKPFTPEETREKLNKVLGGTTNGEKSPDTGDEEFDF
jgi:two-component system chemotaxis response regulator CheY